VTDALHSKVETIEQELGRAGARDGYKEQD
jgi:hypothetical protein